MDIVAISNNINSIKTMTSVNVSLLKKSLDTTNENAQLLIKNIKEMEVSVNPNLGSKIDLKI